MKKVAIVGYGLEGRSALRYFQDQGADITVCDRDEDKDVPAGVAKHLGPDYLQGLNEFDVVMRTAGMNPAPILEANPGIAPKVTTTVNEFLRVYPNRNIIGVTGTKGKGTTCTLIVKMLEAAGKDVFLGGNFGISPFDFLPKIHKDTWTVLELSSFMLHDITNSPHIGICLMVQPEHLDWHGNKDEYFAAKANMFKHQKPDDVAIYYAESILSHKIASNSPGDKIAYYDEPGAYIHDDKIMIDQTVLCKTSELKLLGKHNWQNVCAAVTAVWQVAQAPDAIRKVLTTFTGLPNRLELVRELDGVKYYNDSFGSDPYATEAAIEAIPGHKVLIVGGYERMLPLEQFAKKVTAHSKEIRQVLLIGASALRVAEAFKKAGFKDFRITSAKTMPEIVSAAHGLAKPGDAVVLSPGFASFDMFTNFEVRGNAFKESVHAL
ncbi:MAG: UDP-N-acetylmuramoyl-L-alanine--D-glutamate ligase [Candidatus Saccharimonadales bacterium]